MATVAVHAQLNLTLKSYYRKKEGFGRRVAEGSSRRMFVEMGTTSQVVIINHHQEDLSKRYAGHALTGVSMETSPRPCERLFTETLRTQSNIFIWQIITYEGSPLSLAARLCAGESQPGDVSGTLLEQFWSSLWFWFVANFFARGISYVGITISRWRWNLLTGLLLK